MTCFMNDGKCMAGYSDGTFVANGHLLLLDELINCMRQIPRGNMKEFLNSSKLSVILESLMVLYQVRVRHSMVRRIECKQF